MKFLAKTCIILWALQIVLHSQDFFEIGVTAGSGVMSSDSPYITGFTSSVSAGAGKLYDAVSPRISLYYVGDINSLLPSNTRDYYPFIKAVALKGTYAVNITGDLYYEQCLGLLAANDRIFNSSNSWGAGFIISVLGGADLRGDSYSGFRVGIGGEYGLTVYNTYIRYLGIFIQAQYIISYNL